MIYVQVDSMIMAKITIFSLSIILLSGNVYSVYLESESHIKSTIFLSKKFEVGLGKIALKIFLDIEFPKGHIRIRVLMLK